MTFEIIVGDALESLRGMEAGSVHTCVTSPPYYGLRDYGIAGQIGLESTPDEWVAKLVAVFAEVRRVLRDDGTLWVNIGDSYASDSKWGGSTGGKHAKGVHGAAGNGRGRRNTGLKEKDLIGIPWMLAFALRADGWYLRQDIIWAKPNPMPEPVRDRCTKSHEYLFLLSKRKDYYFDRLALSEPCSTKTNPRASKAKIAEIAAWRKLPNGWDTGAGSHGSFHRNGRAAAPETRVSPKTVTPGNGIKNNSSFANATILPVTRRNKRSVWTVTTRGFKGAHFATFPPALIEPCILAGAPVGGLVLDPFAGAGTTGLVAVQHGRRFVGLELNPDYAEMSRRRIEAVA